MNTSDIKPVELYPSTAPYHFQSKSIEQLFDSMSLELDKSSTIYLGKSPYKSFDELLEAYKNEKAKKAKPAQAAKNAAACAKL